MDKINYIDIYYGIVVEFEELYLVNSKLTEELYDKNYDEFCEVFSSLDNGSKVIINEVSFDVDSTIYDEDWALSHKPSVILGNTQVRVLKDSHLCVSYESLVAMDKSRFDFDFFQKKKLPEKLQEKNPMFYFLPRRY